MIGLSTTLAADRIPSPPFLRGARVQTCCGPATVLCCNWVQPFLGANHWRLFCRCDSGQHVDASAQHCAALVACVARVAPVRSASEAA